jgi:hypothetical protein
MTMGPVIESESIEIATIASTRVKAALLSAFLEDGYFPAGKFLVLAPVALASFQRLRILAGICEKKEVVFLFCPFLFIIPDS